MANKTYTITNTSYIVSVDNYLTNIDRLVLTNLYLPIIGNNALSIYAGLYTSIEENSVESSIITHQSFLIKYNFTEEEFIKGRSILEGIGLLDTYIKDSVYLYILKMPLSFTAFFSNMELVHILTSSISIDKVNELYDKFLSRKLDSSKMNNITSKFSDVFYVENKDTLKPYSVMDFNNEGIKIVNKDFNMEQFILLLELSNIVSKDVLNDMLFIDTVNRLSYLFGLNIEEMKNATIKSANSDKLVDYNRLKKEVKAIFDSKKVNVNYKPVSNTSSSNDKAIQMFETLSPNHLVNATFKTELTSPELSMIDDLIIETGLPLGVINFCLFHTMKQKNGEIPAKNYFLKILNTWKRANVTTTKGAIEYVNGGSNVSTNRPKNNKTVKKTPEWYNEYASGQKSDTSSESSAELSEEVANFFKPNK